MSYTRHGHSRSPEYKSWANAFQRCYNPTHVSFKNYGGRGIKVCPEWHGNFKQFLEDLGPRPSPKHSLDRIDTHGNYSKANCKWSTPAEQARNKRNNRLITLGGVTKCLQDWANQYGINAPLLRDRLVIGWSFENAVSIPVYEPLTITYSGRTMTIRDWALEYGMKPASLLTRHRNGWSAERALNTPIGRYSRKSSDIQIPVFATIRKHDLTGQRFGDLTVVGEAPKRGASPNARWICRCDCGNHTEALSHNLKSKKTKSCGKHPRGNMGIFASRAERQAAINMACLPA